MAEDLDGTVALVTGASSGIGQATATALAARGASVALVARRTERLDELAAQIREGGGQTVTITADVTDEAQARQAVEKTVQELGRIDTVVNNAGVMLLGPVEDASLDDWRRMVDVNVLGLLYCTHAALPLMRAAGEGDVVNISSVAGRRAGAGAAVYNLTKFGVTAFSEALRQEALHHGIRVTCVEPGMVDTELQGHNKHPAVRQSMARSAERIGTPLSAEDIARTIVWALQQPQHVGLNEVLIRPLGET
jgi:clavulanate-9-aldehyde reducatase